MPENIADGTRPNAGRIYDYLLGGHHNFEIDRQAGEQLKRLSPSMSMGVRLQRWCLQDLAVELTEKRGYDVIIDFASGLPTQDHIHHVVPAGTTVIYSDSDPVTVAYAHEILGDLPDVYYLEGDARYPEKVLTHPQVVRALNGRRNVAFVHWGVAAFLADEELAHAAQSLYQWSGPRSCWAFNAQATIAASDNPNLGQAIKVYEQAGTKVYLRSLE